MTTETGSAPGVLVDPEWVADHLEDPSVGIVEADVSKTSYDEGHLPGAVHWNAYTDLLHPDLTPIGPDEFAALLSASGLSPDTTIVVYGYAGHLAYWLLRGYGHARVVLLEAGRERWRAAGLPWSTRPAEVTRTSYPECEFDRATLVSRQDVATLADVPGALIVDVRSAAEFEGERFWPSGATEGAGRPGRIPGAIHVPVDLVREDDGRLRSAAALRRVFAERGVEPDRTVITYCTIGNRASEVSFALLEVLGYSDVRVYYASWAEWGTRTDTPVET